MMKMAAGTSLSSVCSFCGESFVWHFPPKSVSTARGSYGSC